MNPKHIMPIVILQSILNQNTWHNRPNVISKHPPTITPEYINIMKSKAEAKRLRKGWIKSSS